MWFFITTVLWLTWFWTDLCWSSVNLFIIYILPAILLLFEACKCDMKKNIVYVNKEDIYTSMNGNIIIIIIIITI